MNSNQDSPAPSGAAGLHTKSNGGQRPLGIPTVKDRVAQMAAYLVLMPIFEADFHPHSFGFRPKRNAHQALDTIVQTLRSGRTEVLDADLSKYFDTIPHRQLLRAVARRVSDGSVLRLLKQWLRAPVVEEDKNGTRRVLPNKQGTGGTIRTLNPAPRASSTCAKSSAKNSTTGRTGAGSNPRWSGSTKSCAAGAGIITTATAAGCLGRPSGGGDADETLALAQARLRPRTVGSVSGRATHEFYGLWPLPVKAGWTPSRTA
ncbi:MAG: hypothetical protein IPK15_22970 [Verrucomicrobia bacterium]|nr:hypothetical protein [Verrucomicrobiota bacterium]